jgi:anaerobic ribonucleoside-triphosphate reductase activating protein
VFRLIKSIARDYPVDGFTLTGGDPMMQSGALKALIPLLRSISTDILVYTGYQKEDLTDEQLDGISVLIDGPYLEHRNNRCPLRGSDNQTIYILDPSLQDRYASYCAENHHQIQNFMTADGIISVGIHRPNFTEELNQIVWKKGLRTHE